MSSSNCCFLTCIKVSQETDPAICYSCLLRSFAQFAVIHTVKCFRIVNESESESRSVVFYSLWPCGLYSPWNSPGQNTGVGNLSLLEGIFPIQVSNPGILHCRQILYQLSHKGSEAEVSEAEINISPWSISPWHFFFFSGSSVSLKLSLDIWRFLVHVLLKPSLKDFGHNLASMWNKFNCMVVWTFFRFAFLGR